MTVNVTSYAGLKGAVQQWLGGRTGDVLLDARFDDHLALHEQRMYYGAKEVVGLLPQFEPLRIREMETVNTTFTLGSTVAQPAGFLELIEASINSPVAPLRVEHEGVIEAYQSQTQDVPKIIAMSGTNFRVWPNPGTSTATIRYYQKLTTPTPAAANWILQNAPGVYLNGCLLQAALMTMDFDSAKIYGALYMGEVGGLNERRNSELRGATNVRVRVRGRTP